MEYKEAGYVFAPYVPIQVTDLAIWSDEFSIENYLYREDSNEESSKV